MKLTSPAAAVFLVLLVIHISSGSVSVELDLWVYSCVWRCVKTPDWSIREDDSWNPNQEVQPEKQIGLFKDFRWTTVKQRFVVTHREGRRFSFLTFWVELSPHHVELWAWEGSGVNSVCLWFSLSQELSSPDQSAELRLQSRSVVWQIPRFTGGTQLSALFKVLPKT